MKWMKSLLFLSLLWIILAGCSGKPRSWWTEPVIAVMADSTEWEPMQSVMNQTFEQVVRTPQSETTYLVRQVPNAQFNHYSTFQYLLVAATLNSHGPVGKMIQNVMADSSVQARVRSGEFIIFSQRDLWAKDQLVVILLAKDVYALRDKIESNSQYVYALFENDFVARIDKDLKGRENKELEPYLMSSFGWSMKLHKDYFMAQEDAAGNAVWFRRLYPERWILVRWIEDADTSYLNADWVLQERARLGQQYYGGDRVVDKYLFSHEGQFLGRTAQITQGLWENDSKVAGGPFKNFTFYDDVSKRIYMIDLALHAPNREKLPLLKRQEQVAKTFYTIFDKKKE